MLCVSPDFIDKTSQEHAPHRVLAQLVQVSQENSVNGYDIHYMEIDELTLPVCYCKLNISDEGIAWEFAVQFASERRGSVVEVYVVNAIDKTPVSGYKDKKISNFEFLKL